MEWAAVAYIKGDYDLAIRYYSDAIRKDPQEVEAYCTRGLAYAHKKDYDKALADLNEAIRLDPKRGSTYRHRGSIYEQKGEKDKAKADFAQARKLGGRGRMGGFGPPPGGPP
jgi:tetratricopeptide (TPR) repeat protein